jgi:superfamily I DNA/RNA helicase
LHVAGAVIAKNDRYEAKPQLRTHRDEGCPVYLVESPDYLSEAWWIAEEVARLVKRGVPYGDMAVLYRAHSHRDPLVEQFRRHKIPFVIRGLSILSTVILRDLVAYLNIISSPHDNISLTRVLLELPGGAGAGGPPAGCPRPLFALPGFGIVGKVRGREPPGAYRLAGAEAPAHGTAQIRRTRSRDGPLPALAWPLGVEIPAPRSRR